MVILYLSSTFLLLAASEPVLSQKVKQHECGLPANIDSLPDYAQVELKDLWSTWVEGTPCLKELAIQQDVLNVVRTFSSDFAGKRTTAVNTSARRSVVPAATTPAGIDDDYEEPHTTPFPRLINAVDEILPKPTSEPIRFDEASIDDIATMRFNNAAKAPFLHSAAPEVRRKFEKVWNDEDIPSEALRTLKIQALAVSLLTAKQLEEYNRWATKRRYVLKARENELRHLSPDAKLTLRRISNRSKNQEKIAVSPAVKRELRNFIVAFNRRRSKLVH
ncbi:hypothetical protein GCK32_006500 [Trichostrongylus colubriformis]|uniref:Uncharacterized protein n=1 Tax=Trichostrongylus colubriformis TaxID=6319 RepID=A0AAN8FUM8_TRICO